MAEIKSGASADVMTVDPTLKAARVSLRPMEGDSYRLCQQSGLFTTIAAGTASAGHLFAFRWSATDSNCAVQRIVAKWRTITGFTAAQEVGMDLYRLTSYSAAHTGGTAATLVAPNLKKRQSFAVTALNDARIATTAALTAGTHVLDAMPMAADCFSELATGAAVPKGSFNMVWEANMDYGGGPLILAAQEGFVIRNSILMGAAGTARLTVEIDWARSPTTTTW